MNLFAFREPVSALSHGIWLVLALPATAWLWRRGGADLARKLSLLIFGLCATFCFGASMLYHGARGPDRYIRAFEMADYIGIYLMIAGTVTPVAWTLLEGRWRRGALGMIWLAAVLGAALNLGLGTLPLSISTAFYLAMGWGAVACYVAAARAVSHRALLPILYGGLFYSVGAALNLLEWPAPWPGVFGHHELFHLFVMAGSFCHFWFMLRVIAPYGTPPARREPAGRRVEWVPTPCRVGGLMAWFRSAWARATRRTGSDSGRRVAAGSGR